MIVIKSILRPDSDVKKLKIQIYRWRKKFEAAYPDSEFYEGAIYRSKKTSYALLAYRIDQKGSRNIEFLSSRAYIRRRIPLRA